MVGNSSAAAVAACAVALHLAAASPGGVVAREVPDDNPQRRRARGAGRLRRRRGGSTPRGEPVDGYGSRTRSRRGDEFGSLPESPEAESLLEQRHRSVVATEEHGESTAGGDGCVGRRWYPDVGGPDDVACTNSFGHPSAWLDDPSVREAFTFDSSEECCATLTELLGGDGQDVACSVVDDCIELESTTKTTTPTRAPTTPSPTEPPKVLDSAAEVGTERRLGCSSHGYHPDTVTGKGCTNSDEHPPVWVQQEQLKARMFHATSKGCCDMFFPPGKGEPCPVKDVCGAGPPPAPSKCRWHLDVKSNDGCSDDNSYPFEWTRQPHMFFDTAAECCGMMMGGNPNCRHHKRGCSGPAPRAATPKPTYLHTPRPTKRPVATPKPTTQRPTQAPTRTPSSSPTYKPFKFYVQETTGMCVEHSEVKMPKWIREKDQYWPQYRQCCRHARDMDLCMKAKPTSINGRPLSLTEPDTSMRPLWFADSAGMCVNQHEAPKPPGAKVFDDFPRCCILGSRNPEKCLSRDVSDNTHQPTPTPPARYYLESGTSLCVNQNEVPMPYDMEVFDDYNQCCSTGWDEEKCLAASPTVVPTDFPTWAPSTAWPTESPICPNSYDSSANYRRGSEVEVNNVVYECRFLSFCNQAKFRPPESDPGPQRSNAKGGSSGGGNRIPITNTIPIKGISGNGDSGGGGRQGRLWTEAWERVGVCQYPPTKSPTPAPTTPSPTCTTNRWHPNFKRRVCTNADDVPMIWRVPPLSETYFVDTAEECCEKFYDNDRCRVRDSCR